VGKRSCGGSTVTLLFDTMKRKRGKYTGKSRGKKFLGEGTDKGGAYHDWKNIAVMPSEGETRRRTKAKRLPGRRKKEERCSTNNIPRPPGWKPCQANLCNKKKKKGVKTSYGRAQGPPSSLSRRGLFTIQAPPHVLFARRRREKKRRKKTNVQRTGSRGKEKKKNSQRRQLPSADRALVEETAWPPFLSSQGKEKKKVGDPGKKKKKRRQTTQPQPFAVEAVSPRTSFTLSWERGGGGGRVSRRGAPSEGGKEGGQREKKTGVLRTPLGSEGRSDLFSAR